MSSDPGTSTRLSHAAKELWEQSIHALPLINPRGLYERPSVFALCEGIRRYLDDNFVSLKDKKFILQCLIEHYQAKDANGSEKANGITEPKKEPGQWYNPSGIYCGPPSMGDNPPGGIRPSGHGGER